MDNNIQDEQSKQIPRIYWVDWLKGLAIALVVFGHTPVLQDTAARWFIYSFHVPAFFILSGVLQRPLASEEPLSRFALKKARRLVVPYFGFSFLAFSLWYILRGYSTNDVSSITTGQAILQHLGGTTYWDQPLWFFLSLFVSELMAFPFYKSDLRVSEVAISVLMVAGLLWVWHVGYGDIWTTSAACLGLPFLVLGHKMAKFFNDLEKQKGLLLALALPLFAVTLWSSIINGHVGMHQGNYGRNIGLFYLSAVAGFLMLMACLPLVAWITPIKAWGKASAGIFAVHWLAGIFLCHAGKRAIHIIGITGETGQIIYWLIYCIFWIVFVWLGWEWFVRLQKRTLGIIKKELPSHSSH